MKLIKNPWIDLLINLVGDARQSIKITSPYVKSNAIDKVLDSKAQQVNLSLITSFKLQNYYKGASDLSALYSILNSGGSINNYQKLHAKTYLFDDKVAIITSANLTNNGLTHNYEYGILIDNPLLVNNISDDFTALTNNEITGKITFTEVEKAKQILASIPKSESIPIPDLELELELKQDDIYTGGIETITPTLKGWQLEVFNCLIRIDKYYFTVADINKFVPELKNKFPDNHHIEAKIRQQLQLLRDNGIIEFLGKGNYRKLWR